MVSAAPVVPEQKTEVKPALVVDDDDPWGDDDADFAPAVSSKSPAAQPLASVQQQGQQSSPAEQPPVQQSVKQDLAKPAIVAKPEAEEKVVSSPSPVRSRRLGWQ